MNKIFLSVNNLDFAQELGWLKLLMPEEEASRVLQAPGNYVFP